MAFHLQRTIPHRGAKSDWWRSHQTKHLPLNFSSHRPEGYDDYTYKDGGSRHRSQAAHVVSDRPRRSLSQNDHETLRPGISHESNDMKDDLEFTTAERGSDDWKESLYTPSDDENHFDSPLISTSAGSLLYSDGLEQDIENLINQIRLHTVMEASQSGTGTGLFHLNVEDEMRSECLPEGLDRPLRTFIEKHRDTVSSRSTDWSKSIPDLDSEYDHDSDNEQESPPEEWYRNASAPSQPSSMTPSAEVRHAYVSLGGRVKSLIGSIREEPLSPLNSRYQKLKPLPPLPGETANPPYHDRANVVSRRSSLQLPPPSVCHEGPQTVPRSHFASQIRMPLPPESTNFPTRACSTISPLSPEPFDSSSSSSAASLDQLRIHPALRNKYKPSLRYSSSGSGNSTYFSPLPPPISAYNPCRNKTRESDSSQSSQPTRSYRRHRPAQSSFTKSSNSSIRHPSTTVSGLDSPTLSTLSYTQGEIRTALEPKQLDVPYTRHHSVGGQLNVGETTSYANTALEIPNFRRHNTDESEMIDLQDHLDDIKELVIVNVIAKLEEVETQPQSLQNNPLTHSKTPSLFQKFGLRRIASDARLFYSQRSMRSTPALPSNSTSALLGDHPGLGSALWSSRSSTQSSSRRSTSRFSRDLSRIVELENQSIMEEVIEKVGIEGAKRPKGGPLRKVYELQSKLSGNRDKDMVPTSSEKAARVLGGLPGYAPSVRRKQRVEEAEEVLRCVEKLF